MPRLMNRLHLTKTLKLWNLLFAIVLVVGLVMPMATPALAATTPNIEPNAAGSNTGLTSSSGDNWDACNDSDGDTSYVYTSNTSYLTDLYALPDQSLTGTINSVTVYMRARATASPTQASAQTAIRTHSNNYFGSAVTLTTSYANYSTTYYTNPNTGIAWTWTEVNDLQAGVQMRRPSSSSSSRCTYVWVVVDYDTLTNTGWNIPTSWSSGGSGTVSTPGNARYSDNQYAVFHTDNDIERYGDFGFAIPAGATIEGIELRVEGYRDSAATPRTFDTSLSWNNGSSWSSQKTNTDLTTAEQTVTLGSSSDTWGSSHTWVPSDFNNGSFLVRIDADSATSGQYLYIDQVQVKVYYTRDTTPPTVTINQAAAQGDPTNTSPINFTVTFSETVTDFASSDVTLSGTAGATTAVVTGSGTIYNVAVSGMTSNGTVVASMAAGVAHDAAGNPNIASTSTDNTVTYDTEWKSPSSFSPGALGGFSSPGNAYASDNSYASPNAVGASEIYGTFGFPSIPNGSIINGIEVYVEGYRGGTSSKAFDISLSWDGGNNYTASNTTGDMGTTPDRAAYLGGSADTWGRSWLSGDFTNANFRAQIKATTSTNINLDCLMVKVYYIINNAPVAFDDSYSTDEDIVLNVAALGVLVNDTDAEDVNPSIAMLVGDVSHGNLTLDSDGSFTYVPYGDYYGADSFTYEANDSQGVSSNTATVYITVNPQPDAPFAVADSYGIAEGNTLNVAVPGVLGNDNDADGDTMTAELVNYAGPGNLTLNSDGSFTYIPSTPAGTQDSFIYQAYDGALHSDPVEVTIYIVVPPSVTTNDASDITINSATLNGNLTDMGNATSVQVSFEWGLDTNYGNETTPEPKGVPGDFSAGLSGLNHSTTYHFRAKAVGDSNVGYVTVYGNDTTFTTKTPPSVATDPAGDITINAATLNGNLTDMGTASPVQVSFEWGLTDSYGNVTSEQPLYSAGAFSAPLPSLSPGITYHFKAVAAGDSTVYGNDTTFTTLTNPPIVATDPAGSVTAGTATLNGNVISLGTVLSLNVSFQWADDAYYTSHGNTYDHETTAQLMTGNGTFDDGLIDLEPDTTYHFRAKAAGQHGAAYGDDATFTTSTVPEWWNPDWSRRSQVLITENSGSLLTDFQVKVVVPYDSDMQPDYDDVRFVDKYNTNLLSYWREDCSEDGASKFWVKVPIVQASGTQRIWMYYGNGNATSASNIHDTFIWGDDFGNETWTYNNINRWHAYGGVSTQGVQNGEYHLEGSYVPDPDPETDVNLSEPIAEIIVEGSDHDDGDTRTLMQFPDNYVVDTDVKGLLNEVGNQAGGAFITARYLNVEEKYEQTLDLQWSNAILNKVAGDDWANLGASWLGYFVAVDKWYELKAVVLREGPTNRLQVAVNNEMYLDDTDSDLSYNGLAFLAFDWDDAFHVVYDNFRVREYASEEPATWVGWEERVDGLPKWWDTSWKRRAPAVITETSGATLTDYQVKIVVPYDSDMQDDFDDVRFVGSDANELRYWRESYTGNSTATFWVKVPSIPASGNQTIWMYYGNPAAGTVSDIHAAFIWGDDFGNTTWTSNNIDALNLSGSTQGVSSDEYRMQGPAGGQAVARIYECGGLKLFPSNYIAEVEIKPVTGFGQAYITPRFHTMYSYTPDTGAVSPTYYTRGGMYEGVLDVEWDVVSLSKTVDGVWTNMYAIPLGYSVEVGQWYKMGTTMLGNGSSNTLQVSVNDVLWIDRNDSDLSYAGLAFLSYGYEEPFDIAYDNFRVRQYASQEPVVAFGAEEWAEPIVATEEATAITTDSAVLNGNLISLGAVTSVDVSFEWGLTDSYGNETASQAMTGNGTFSILLPGLDHSTTYHFRAKAVGDSTVFGDDMEFTTKTPPTVVTVAFSDITINSATLSGNLTSMGTALSVNVSFEWATHAYYTGNGNTYNNETTPQAMTGNGTFSTPLVSLDHSTIYHFRAKAVGDSTVYGDDMTFTTKTPPTVFTNAASDITIDSATLNGNLTNLGTASSVAVSFEWGLTQSYGNETPVQPMIGTGTFNAPLSGLNYSTTYHFRAKAVGDSTVYGDDMEFTTKTPPTVFTNAASDITIDSATLNGNLTSLGTASPVNVSFEWGLTDSYGNETPVQPMIGTGTFNAPLLGLNHSTTYHFRAKAVGDSTVYGEDMQFTTKTPPTVVTNAASDVTIDSATLNGNLANLGTASPVAVSFEWGLTDSYGNETTPQSMTGTGTFNAPLGSLDPGTTYHFRAKAVGDSIVNGDDMTFTTNNIKGVTGEVNCSILPGATVSIYDGAVLIDSTVSDSNGYYELKAVATGTYQVTVSKSGFRDVTRPISIAGPGLYTLDFISEYGLVPNAPNMSYVLLCVNHWLYPPPSCGLSMSRVLQVVNAWLYPIL